MPANAGAPVPCFQRGQLRLSQAQSLPLEGKEGVRVWQARPYQVSLSCHCDKKIYFSPPSLFPIPALSLKEICFEGFDNLADKVPAYYIWLIIFPHG